MANIILTTSCDDKYLWLLSDMLESLGSKLSEYNLGIVDLGLSEESKNKIKSYKPDVKFAKAKWFFDVPEKYKKIANQAYHSKLFQPEYFPNYDGYVHIDSDIWFANATAVDDLVKAGEKHGISIIEDPYDTRTKRIRFLGIVLGSRQVPPSIAYMNRFYGKAEADRLCKSNRILNGGFFYIKGGHPIWKEYQAAGQKAVDYNGTKRVTPKLCDQTALLYALLDTGTNYEILPQTHNWVEREKFILDDENGKLLHSEPPHEEIKVLHLTGKSPTWKYNIKTTSGKIIEKTYITYTALKEFLH